MKNPVPRYRFVVTLALAALTSVGCGAYQSFIAGSLRSPGRVEKDSKGWTLHGMLIPAGQERMVAVTVQSVEDEPKEAKVSLMLNVPDSAFACESAGFDYDGKSVALKKVQQLSLKTTESAEGRIAILDLKAIAEANVVKLKWCKLELELKKDELVRLAEYANMVGG